MLLKNSYFYIFVLSLASLAFAHFFLQHYLFMRPCEHCVHIRFAMSLLVLGAFLGLLSDFLKLSILNFFIFFFLFLGFILGFFHSFSLNEIYKALEQNNPFGVVGCSSEAKFIFSLPLQRYFPQLFEASGICGLESIFVDNNAQLSFVQEFFIGTKAQNFSDGIYSKGWFLIPSLKFLNMAEACLILFFVMGLCFLMKLFKLRKSFLSIILAFILAFLVFLYA